MIRAIFTGIGVSVTLGMVLFLAFGMQLVAWIFDPFLYALAGGVAGFVVWAVRELLR